MAVAPRPVVDVGLAAGLDQGKPRRELVLDATLVVDLSHSQRNTGDTETVHARQKPTQCMRRLTLCVGYIARVPNSHQRGGTRGSHKRSRGVRAHGSRTCNRAAPELLYNKYHTHIHTVPGLLGWWMTDARWQPVMHDVPLAHSAVATFLSPVAVWMADVGGRPPDLLTV